MKSCLKVKLTNNFLHNLKIQNLLTDKLEIANKFNAFFFTNIGNHLANNIKYKGFRDHSYYLNKKVNSVFTFKFF